MKIIIEGKAPTKADLSPILNNFVEGVGMGSVTDEALPVGTEAPRWEYSLKQKIS